MNNRNYSGRFKKGMTPWNYNKKGKYNYITIDEQSLRECYLNNNMTIMDCAERFGCSNTPIRKALGKYNIPKRKMTIKEGVGRGSFKGMRHSKESNDKNRMNHLGKKHTEECKAKMSMTRKGKKLTEEHREKIRSANLGEKSHFYNGGLSHISELIRATNRYNSWRKQVYKRDRYTCKICGATNCVIEAHHIVPLVEILNVNDIKKIEDAIACDDIWDTTNGITLCRSCHIKVTKDNGGYANWRKRK